LEGVARLHDRHPRAFDERGQGVDVWLGAGQGLVADGVRLGGGRGGRRHVETVVGKEGEGLDVLRGVLDPRLDVQVVLERGHGRIGADRHPYDVAEVVERILVCGKVYFCDPLRADGPAGGHVRRRRVERKIFSIKVWTQRFNIDVQVGHFVVVAGIIVVVVVVVQHRVQTGETGRAVVKGDGLELRELVLWLADVEGLYDLLFDGTELCVRVWKLWRRLPGQGVGTGVGLALDV